VNPTRRWIWALGGLVAVLAIALIVVVVARDDSSESASTTTTAGPSTSTTNATTSTSSAPATTTLAPTTTTVALPVITANPQSYAEYLFAAWQNGNQTAAAKVASADAVTQMFAQAYPAKGPYTFSNCGPAAGSLYCTWNGQNGTSIQMTVRTLTGGLPIQVEQVQFMG
jgi:cytoskeletal protein RodZ